MIKHQQKYWEMLDVIVKDADPHNGDLQEGDIQILWRD